MLARDETPRLLSRALFRFWMTSRSYLVQVGILLAVTLGAALVMRSVVSVAIVVAVVVLTQALLYVRCQRSARAYAPPGFTLGLCLRATHLAVRHAVATTVTPYASWQSVERQGDAVILCTRRGGVLPLPAELVLPALAQLQALVGPGADGSDTRPADRRRAPAAFLRVHPVDTSPARVGRDDPAASAHPGHARARRTRPAPPRLAAGPAGDAVVLGDHPGRS